jgi:predicted Zn-dependent protease
VVNDRVFELIESYLEELDKAQFTSEHPNGQSTIYRPFFSSIAVKSTQYNELLIQNGGTMVNSKILKPDYIARLETRIGDYEKGGSAAYNYISLPRDLDIEPSMIDLWITANNNFWDSVDEYEQRYGNTLGVKNSRDKFLYMSREPAHKFIEDEKKIDVDWKGIEAMLKDVSKTFSNYPEILISTMAFTINNDGNYFVNSEGAKIFTSYARYSLGITMYAHGLDNLAIPITTALHSIDLSTIPTEEQLIELGEKLREELSDIIKAPIQRNGLFPAILDYENHGVIWHEAVGHALEGHRMQEDEFNGSVSLFNGKIDEQIAPGFLSLYDDPTVETLDGHYKFDSEGVRAQKVMLVEGGVLKNYLHSRQSAGYFKTRSNGHCRESIDDVAINPLQKLISQGPCPRMSNLFVESANETSFEELTENLIKLCEEQGREYGLILQGCGGGIAMPEESFFNTYPAHVHRVHKNGDIERVRGIYIVGTPYQILDNIIQTSDQYGLFNGTCGAESGWVPSTQVAPDALVKSLEVNTIPRDNYPIIREPVLPKPKF